MDRIARINTAIAGQIGASAWQVAAAIALLDEGSTVPFIARYRKEATGGLDDTQLRMLAERVSYFRELDDRRDAILKSIQSQDKLEDRLRDMIETAETKRQLEDIYLPYKPKRRTKAAMARENGLEPLLEAILCSRTADPEVLARSHVVAAVPDTARALEGARDILTEQLSETTGLIRNLREYLEKEAVVTAKVIAGQEEAGAKFADYFDRTEKWSAMPSHRALALLRAVSEGVIRIRVGPDEEDGTARCENMVVACLNASGGGAGNTWLRDVGVWAWKTKLSSTLASDFTADLRARAQKAATAVFARNLKELLLAAPAGARPTLGLDPGIRTGVKAAVVDGTGKVLATETLYPFPPRKDATGARLAIVRMIEAHGVELIAIGDGTGSRETDALVAEALAMLPDGISRPTRVVVSEAGASVYSASEPDARKFPDIDVSLRGAVSIARRLQDLLAELVKIEPKSIGVGQCQHDVDQRHLSKSLDAVVEDAVNAVGVDLNTASAALLAHISGLTPGLADATVAHRDQKGPFSNRKGLLKVARLGPRAFEQCAGFLRIHGSKEPLDASAVHPEAHNVARRIVANCGRDLRSIQSGPDALKNLRPQDYMDERFGLPTVRDILADLERPGRDPRPTFKTATFAEGIEKITDLKTGMLLEGRVTNVETFGAFVDIGVHQDGLVHVSQLADRFVSNPHDLVKAGDVVQVRVTEIDVQRNRIALTMRKGPLSHEGPTHKAPSQ